MTLEAWKGLVAPLELLLEMKAAGSEGLADSEGNKSKMSLHQNNDKVIMMMVRMI